MTNKIQCPGCLASFGTQKQFDEHRRGYHGGHPGKRPSITDAQVRTAIDVLQAYTDGTLRTDLCDELDEAIEKAFDVLSDEPDEL